MKTLNVLFAVLFYFSLCVTGFAQSNSDCKFDTDKTDAKTGAVIKKIKAKLTGTETFYFGFARNDTAYTLLLNFWLSGALRESIDKGDKVTIKLSGGDNLILRTNSQYLPQPHYGDQSWTEYSPEYPIRSEDVERIKDLKPLELNLKIGIETISRLFNKKDNEKIVQIIKCIMK